MTGSAKIKKLFSMLLSLIVIKTRIKNNNPKPIMPAKKVTKILIRRIIVSQWFFTGKRTNKKGHPLTDSPFGTVYCLSAATTAT